jgi:tyrosine-protein kinase Etk/Wzc
MRENQELFSSNIDYKKIINRLLSFKVYYFTIVPLLIFLAFLFNRYSEVEYENHTMIFLNNQDNKNLFNSPNDLIKSFGLFDNQKIVENELEILKSFSLVKKAINEMDLKVTYFSTRNSQFSNLLFETPFARRTEHYDDSPIKILLDLSLPQATNLNFKITFLNENEFMITASGEKVPLYNYIDDQIVSIIPTVYFKQRYKFDDEIKTKYFNFKVQKDKYFRTEFTRDYNLYFTFNNINNLTLSLEQSLKTEAVSQTSTLIKVTFIGNNRVKVTDFLNNLSSAYIERNMEKKNKMALSTVNFIDSQISDVADSLHFVESKLKDFRTSAGVMDLSFQGQQIFEQLNKLENEKAAIDVQRNYYQYLDKNLALNSELNDLSAPSSMNVVDPIMTNLVTQLITLNSERASLLKNASNQQNLYLADINIKIENIKKTIRETVKNTLDALNMSLNEINYRMNRATGQISEMPKTELQLRGIERKFQLSDAIYTFLLQKRAEAQISSAASMPDYEIIDPAILAISKRVSPKSKLNYIIALFLGLMIPTSFVLLKDFLNNKITDTDEVEEFPVFPILGRIFHNFHRNKMIVRDYPNSSVTESFRSIRTNLQFFTEGGKKQVILLTSSTSGEGKTFCSMNLATVMALNGHRTVLLEFDLRRPKIFQEFTSNNMIGISSFLIDKATIDDIIIPTPIENLDFIPAGPTAPNPAELINSERTAELIDKLKEMYDYLIIDSAPAGILTETYLLMKFSDLNIFIVRLNKTVKDTLKQTFKNLQANRMQNITLIINDIFANRESAKYGYDKRYYTDDVRKGFFGRIFRQKHKSAS